ncbi:protein split ends isoform X2 [Nylanderia fulva]|uniref:protein split ends isoform X2 n=1 Tax=Nylanderia fulva TaxID=613905 RepID=UPI0010FB939B|nr:protein split ends isoform X2 [Nylanderia fulva]
MSTADTALSISINMAPGPEHRQEPVAPDKIAEGDRAADVDSENVDITTTTTTTGSSNSNDSVAPVVVAEQSSNVEIAPTNFVAAGADSANQSSPSNSTVDSKQQEEPATLSELNDSELRALLDEAITYKCPKDREGKSHLFKELLQEAEADETEEGHRVICNSRCLPGSNRRRHKRDSVSERLTHGGSLQNLAHPIASEFDSSFAYPTSSSCHTYGSSRKKNKKYIGPSVSARQREGGSLPSDVDASHSLASLANLDLSFDKKSFCVERSAYDWTNKEKSKSLDKPSYTSTKKEEKEKEKKELKRDTASSGEIELESREKRVGKGKYGTNEMLESDNPPPEYKSDYMVIDLGDVEVGAISERNVGSMASGIQRPRSLDTENDEGTEMRIIEPRKPIHYVTRATLDVDSPIEFPIRDHKQEKSKMSINGADVTGTLFQSHNSVKCGISGASNSSSTSQSKIVPSLCSVMPSWQAQNITMEGPRYSSQHLSLKDPSVSGEKKSLDENGNAVQSYNDRFAKKLRRKHTQEHNVKVYNAENVEGHRNEDIDSLINFIENKESKSKKGKTSNPVRVKTSSGTKPRTREKDTKREQLPSKLQKSNSLEEISKTKLEDLTTEKSISSSGASSVSSQHGENVALRRPKQRSTGDATVDSRGDRRSWGTEEGQSIYCNDTGEDYTSRRNSNKKINPESEHETEFLVVTKKKKSKKQRRSSSGSRAQNLTTSGSYLQSSRGFSNEYRTPLSPELRRKSASSMPPSDKSDSSDLDSVHSLPVTSNSSKHNLTKVATSSGGTPQASYADIARMATINISHNLNMSTIVPGMLNTASWPSVPSKTSSEPDKVPQDYYPSLDEIQHSERKVRQQQNSAQSNHAAASLSLAFEKSLSPTLTKVKNSSDRKKAEAQEEAINKNIQVFKYVQDIEKMQESLSQEQKHHSASNNYSTNTSETIATNTVTPRLNNSTTMNYNPLDADNNPNCAVNNKDSVTHSRTNNPRSRRSYVHNNQSVQMIGSYEEQYVKKFASSYHDEPIKKSYSTDTPQSENKPNPTVTSHNDGAQDVQKKTAKLAQESQESVESESSSNKNKLTSNEPRTARVVKEYPNNNITMKHDVAKVGICQTIQNSKQDQVREDTENKRTKSQPDKDQSQRSSSVIEVQQTKNSTPRPAVILLDETTSDIAKNNNLPTELTFGFEINEQLLLSEDNGNEETQAIATSSPAFSSAVPPLVNKSSLNTFERNPLPLFNEKPARYDKFSSNYHMQTPNAHMTPVHPVMVQPLPYMGYPNTRFPPPTYLPPPPPPPPGIMEKFHPPKEDFAMLYVAPEEELNVQTYNHDKIVSFVGLAWDAVMRENVTATGRIQFYSGQ